MDTTTGEPSAVSTLLVSVVFVTISITLLRALARSMQRSARPDPVSPDHRPPGASSPWSGGSVLMLFAFFFLGQLAIMQLAVTPSLDPDGADNLELSHPATFVGLSLLNLILSLLAMQLYRLRTMQQLESGESRIPSFWLESGGNAFRAIRLGVIALLCWIPGHIGLAGIWDLTLRALEIEVQIQSSVQLTLESIRQSDWTLLIPLCFYGAVMAPIGEEVLFRGVLFRWLKGHWGFIGAVVASSIFFALIHDSIASWLPVAALGGVCAWLYHRSGQLLASVALHSAFNSSMFLLMSLFKEEI